MTSTVSGPAALSTYRSASELLQPAQADVHFSRYSSLGISAMISNPCSDGERIGERKKAFVDLRLPISTSGEKSFRSGPVPAEQGKPADHLPGPLVTSARKSPSMSFECRIANFCVCIAMEILWKIVMCCVFLRQKVPENYGGFKITGLSCRPGRGPAGRIFQNAHLFAVHRSPGSSCRRSQECHGRRTGRNPLPTRSPV